MLITGMNGSLLRAMLDHAKHLSSKPNAFFQECNLKGIFLKIKYPEKLIDSTINNFQHPPDLSQSIAQPLTDHYAI